MYKYSFKGQCPENREKALSEVEGIIKNHGFIVAFNKSTDTTINLMIEVAETKVESLLSDLEKCIEVLEFNSNETHSGTSCKVLLSLIFSN